MERMFYLAELIGGLNKVCTAFAILFFIALILGWAGRIISSCVPDEYDDNSRRAFKKVSRISTIFGVIFIVAAIIIPSKQTYLLMMGGKVVDMTVENNPKLQEIPGKTIDLLDAWIEEETINLKNEHNGESTE